MLYSTAISLKIEKNYLYLYEYLTKCITLIKNKLKNIRTEIFFRKYYQQNKFKSTIIIRI